mgnify:FL=1|jgi:two-component system sensor histidine kinase YesM
MRGGTIFNRFLFLIVAVVIIPMILVYTVVSSILIATLHDGYNDTVDMSAFMAAKAMRDAVSSVTDTSVSVIGNTMIREYLTCDEEGEELLRRHSAARNSVEGYHLNNNYIAYILVTSLDGSRVLSTDANYARYSFTEKEKERMLDSNGAWFWTQEENGRFAVCRLMRNVNRLEEKIGFIKILINEERLRRQLYANDARAQFSYALFEASEENVVMSTDPGLNEFIVEVLRQNEDRFYQGSRFVKQEGKRYAVFTRINTRTLYLVTIADDRTLYYGIMKYGVIILFIFLFLVAAGLYTVIYRKNIAVPLAELSSHMKFLKSDSGAPEQVSLEARGEVRELVDSFNEMSKRLDYLYETNYKNELKLRDANLLILQSEMNPHFLYNTLDSIRWMIEMGQNGEASRMVQQLSEMFRLSLYLSESSVITLGKELEYTEKYIFIEKIRFRGRVHFQLNVQEEIENLRVVKFILQPLIENALVHGISKKNGYGNVILSVYVSGEELVYDIRDDGCGADPIRIEQILNQSLVKKNSLEGFALENIQSRIKLRHGERYGITFRPREGGGSIFIVRQPLIYKEDTV